MDKFNPLDHPIGLMYPTRLARSPWTGHVPFAMTVIDLVRPTTLVELGNFTGVSYGAFCQAIAHLRLNTRAFAVGGRPPPGADSAAAFDDLRAFHDPLYGDFSRLVPSTFDEALPHFPDGAIDLLHIDGDHPYEAVQHDFAVWLPKMSRRGVVLLHAINVREANAGVWKLWQVIQDCYPSFDLFHEHGLGLVVVGPEVPEGLCPLLDSAGAERVAIRDYYCQLGRRVGADEETATFKRRLAEDQARHEAQLAALHAQHEAQVAALHSQHQADIREHQTELQVYQARAGRMEAAHAKALAQEQAQLVETRARLVETQQLMQANQAQVEEKNALLQGLQAEITVLHARAQEKKTEMTSLAEAYRRLQEVYQHLHAEMRRVQADEEGLRAALEQTRASLAWRLAHFLARCSHTVAPRGTRRRRVLGTARRAVRAVRHSRVRGVLSRATARLWQMLW